MIRLVVHEPSPSLNDFMYSHWRKHQAAKKHWAWLLKRAAGSVEAATGKRRLTVERHGKRPLDQDNLVGGCKRVIVDNLRAMGLIVDDDDRHLELVCRNVQLPSGEQPYTVLVLEDVGE